MSSTTYWLVDNEVINLRDRLLIRFPHLMIFFNLIFPVFNILGVRVKSSLFSRMFKQLVFIEVNSKITLTFIQTKFFLILLQVGVKQTMIVCSKGGQRFHSHKEFLPFLSQSAMWNGCTTLYFLFLNLFFIAFNICEAWTLFELLYDVW